MNNIKEKMNAYGCQLADKYKHNLLTDNDLSLLNLMFNENPTQNELDEFLKNYDIEVASGYKALMLSYFMRMHPNLNFSKYETPRLKGLFNYYRFQNMKLISYFMKIGKVFNKNNIPMLILKGFAMKYLRQDLSRAMGDIDILVPENKFVEAIDICRDLEFSLEVYVHSIDIHEPSSDAGIMDIHRYIDMKNRKERPLNKFLFKRAKKAKFNGIEILVPSYEDLLFLSLINLALNLESKTSKPSTLYVLFDCKYLISQPNFNWDIVIENIKLTKTQEKVAFAIKFINNIVPNLIPSQLYNHPLLKNRINDRCIQISFSNYTLALQKIMKKIKIKHILEKKISIKAYLKGKIYYKFCKSLNKSNHLLIKTKILDIRENSKKREYIVHP